MNFEQSCTVPLSRPELWAFLMDVPHMALCVPGVERVTATSDGQYEGLLRVRVGPMSLALEGVMTVQEADEANWSAAMVAEARDRKVGGGLHAVARMQLEERGDAETELVIKAEARLLGKLGEFGQPVIRKKAQSVVADFVRNIASRSSGAPLQDLQ